MYNNAKQNDARTQTDKDNGVEWLPPFDVLTKATPLRNHGPTLPHTVKWETRYGNTSEYISGDGTVATYHKTICTEYRLPVVVDDDDTPTRVKDIEQTSLVNGKMLTQELLVDVDFQSFTHFVINEAPKFHCVIDGDVYTDYKVAMVAYKTLNAKIIEEDKAEDARLEAYNNGGDY
tara:strand:- start:2022 stop:2549 length:528 start_codon:yes stop_codon:yes gene_type:complete